MHMEKLKLEKLAAFTKAERGRLKSLAMHLDVSESYLSQMISGERPFRIDLCPMVEHFTSGAVTRHDCRPLDGERIWPTKKFRSKAKRNPSPNALPA